MKQTYSTIALLCLFTYAVAQTKTSFSLKEAVDYAVANNYTVKNRELDTKIATAQKNEQGAKGLPQINGNVDLLDYLQNQKNVLENGIGFSTRPDMAPGEVYAIQLGLKYQLLPTVSGSQVLFDKSFFAALQASKVYEQMSQKNLTMSKIDVALIVTKAYYAVLVNQKQLAYIDASLGRVDSTYQQTKAEFENGLARQIELDRSEVNLNNLKAEKTRVKRLLDLSKVILKFQMNIPVNDSIYLTDDLNENSLVGIVAPSDIKSVYSNRIEYSIIETQALLNKYDTKSSKGGLYPRLSAIGLAGYNPGASQFADLAQSNRWYFYSYMGLRLQVPLFNGFSAHYRVQQRKLQEEKTANDKLLLEQRIGMEMDQSLISFENSIEFLGTQKRNLELSENTLKVLKVEHEEGISTNLQVTVAEAEFKNALTNYYNALYTALVAKADYERAIGTLYK